MFEDRTVELSGRIYLDVVTHITVKGVPHDALDDDVIQAAVEKIELEEWRPQWYESDSGRKVTSRVEEIGIGEGRPARDGEQIIEGDYEPPQPRGSIREFDF